MSASRPVVVVAETPAAIAPLESALASQALEVLHAYSYDEALEIGRNRAPDLYVVGYHFDEMRPYRLISSLRSASWGKQVPILVIRALALQHTAPDEEQVKQSYRSLGANDYVSLHDEAQRRGPDAALRHFARIVGSYLGSKG